MRQHIGIFLCLLILGSQVQATQNTLSNKQQILNDIQDKNSEFYQLLEEGSQYVVDEVLNLLKNLEDAAKADLEHLIKAWQTEKQLLDGILEKATQTYNGQVKICNKLEAEQHILEATITRKQDEIHRNKGVQESNNQTIKTLQKQRCKANDVYVDHIVAHRDAILLFKLLLKAIEDYKAGSFVQIENVNTAQQRLYDFINHYASQHTAEFQQVMAQLDSSIKIQSLKNHDLVNTKLASKKDQVAHKKVKDFAHNAKYNTVGRVQDRKIHDTKHVDNTNGQIVLKALDQNSVRALADVKNLLEKVLNTLLTNEKSNKKKEEENEAKANQALADVKQSLQDESRKLARRNEYLVKQIKNLKAKLYRKIHQVKQCRVQEARLKKTKDLAQKFLNEAKGRFNGKKSVLVGEVALFKKLYLYYKERVYAVATKADKKRVQDFVDNKNLDKTGRQRTAEKFNGLKGHVAQNAHAAANKVTGKFKGL